jgi:hypothetical protein
MSKRSSARGRQARRDPTAYKSRLDQIAALATDAIITTVDDPDDPDAVGASLELFIKEEPRGHNYVSDFLYSDPRLPVTIYGVLLSSPTGLIIGEMELFRAQWGYFDDYGTYVGPEGDWRAKGDDEWDVSAQSEYVTQRPHFEGITGAFLRGIPIGRILAWAHEAMADKEWHDKGLTMLGFSGTKVVPAPELADHVRAALERTAAIPARRRGRPPLPDELLEDVALAYLEEAKRGRGLTRRLATRFDRPEETIRDWIHTCRVRGYLSPGATGRRGAQPGIRLLGPSKNEEEEH